MPSDHTLAEVFNDIVDWQMTSQPDKKRVWIPHLYRVVERINAPHITQVLFENSVTNERFIVAVFRPGTIAVKDDEEKKIV